MYIEKNKKTNIDEKGKIYSDAGISIMKEGKKRRLVEVCSVKNYSVCVHA